MIFVDTYAPYRDERSMRWSPSWMQMLCVPSKKAGWLVGGKRDEREKEEVEERRERKRGYYWRTFPANIPHSKLTGLLLEGPTCLFWNISQLIVAILPLFPIKFYFSPFFSSYHFLISSFHLYLFIIFIETNFRQMKNLGKKIARDSWKCGGNKISRTRSRYAFCIDLFVQVWEDGLFSVVPVSLGHGDAYSYLRSRRKRPHKRESCVYSFLWSICRALLLCGTCC